MLIGADDLAARLEDPRVRVVDMRWREDGTGRALYERSHIPGAVYLDWAVDLVDPDADVAFLLAPAERFAAAMGSAGIGDGTTVVAYADEHGSGPMRLWWALAVYGHHDALVLDGGLDAWLAGGGAMTAEPPVRRAATFTPRPGPALIAGAADVLGAERGAAVVVDTRPPEQFRGEAVWFETGAVPADADGIARTPRGAMTAGRVPWARSLPWSELYLPDGRFRPPGDLRRAFSERGVGPGDRVITYCGVGISASAGLFAARLAGIEDTRLYDGSWEDWVRDPARPVARG